MADDDVARGREQDGLLRGVSLPWQVQALPCEAEARWQDSAPGQLRHRRGGGAVLRAIARGAGGGWKGGAGGESGRAPCRADRRHLQGGGHGPAYAGRHIRQGGRRGPAHASRCIHQG
mgnify:CR=1 FL=1